MNHAFINLLQENRVSMGDRLDPLATGRLAEARRITSLMRREGGGSLVRLGDYDLTYLLAAESGFKGNLFPDDHVISGTEGKGSPGLDGAAQAARLRASLENADYVDFWDLQWKDDTLIRKLSLNRSPGTTRNPTRETSFILPTWMEYEFKAYCQGRKVLFCGAEAPLLQELLNNRAYRYLARDYWPDDCQAFFLRPREDGRNLASNLESIKQDLAEAIKRWEIDTLFLSLGGGAKILCCELASELGISAIDFGALTRSLTYSGSDGNRASRSTHKVYLFRVPFGIYMDALEKAYPDFSPEVLLAKAHAQLLLEVQEKEVGWSHSAWENDLSADNIIHFQRSFGVYKRRYNHLFKHSEVTRKERADFLHFCGTHKLTSEGRFYLVIFKIKSLILRLIKR